MGFFPTLLLVVILLSSVLASGSSFSSQERLQSSLVSYNSTPGSSHLFQITKSCGNLTSLVNHGAIHRRGSSTTATLYLLNSEPKLDPQPKFNFTTSYNLSTSPDGCALGSAFALHKGSTISATGCYSSTNNLPTNVSLLLVRGLQTFSDHYCDWGTRSIKQYPFSACGPSKDEFVNAPTTLDEDGDYYFVLKNRGTTPFTRTQVHLSVGITGYGINASNLVNSCNANTNETCNMTIDGKYYAVLEVDQPENSSYWQEYIETKVLCSSSSPPHRGGGSDKNLPPWGYGIIAGGAILFIIIIVVPVLIAVGCKCRSKRIRNNTGYSSVDENRNRTYLLSDSPPSYNAVVFGQKVAGRREDVSRGDTGEESDQGEAAKPPPTPPIASETRDRAPEMNGENEEFQVGSPRSYVAALF